MTSAKRSLKPFHVHIATFFIMLFTLLGIALLSIQFKQNMRQGVEHARQSFVQSREQLSLALQLNEQPARMSLNLLRNGKLEDMDSLEARLSYLAQMVTVLANRPSYGAIYIGYQDGDFFLVRKLTKVNSGALLDKKIPINSVWLVQSMHHGVGEFLYYDKDLVLITRHIEPEYSFDPRSREWYKQASRRYGIVVNRPYLFFTTKEPGMTMAVQSINRRTVMGLDISVKGLSTMIGTLDLPMQSQVVIFDEKATLLATNPADMPSFKQFTKLPTLAMLGHPAMDALQQQIITHPTLLGSPAEIYLSTVSGHKWLVSLSPLGEDSPFNIALMVSHEQLQKQARHEAFIVLRWAIMGLLLLLPVIWWVSKRTATPLIALTKEAERIQHFDFGESRMPESAIREIDDLARTMSSMRRTLGNFMNMGRALAAEHRFDSLNSRILHETIAAVQAKGGCLYLAQQHEMQPVYARWQQADLAVGLVPWQQALLSGLASSQRISLTVDKQVWAQHLSGWGPFLGSCQLVAEPLRNHRQVLIGCLLLILPRCSEQELASRISLIEALAGMSASAIENQRLLEEQKQLLESFIELMAGAIDAKSPYTGGHCQRVPELTRMLTAAACAQLKGPFAGFTLNDEEWEAIHIASWLHDCGKVTTPEFVVDKATKLETIYDRIHEIRTRFEVLKRDVYIECLAAHLPQEVRSACRDEAAPRWAELDQEFAFIAECNLGGELMAPEKIERLNTIARRTWLRTLDDRLGISREELKLRQGEPAPELPFLEPLLADKSCHLIPRPEQERFDEHNSWNFKVKVPHYLYNRGERYNLAISRGTLTEEERYKINEHIIQTIRMLERLPFPRHLRSVPEIAGGHHERMDGRGYPRQLTGQQMSVPARIMVIADIFEALTASDRPYKSGKSVSQALAIMANMVREQHIDPNLFTLFVSSGIWREYAARFLAPEQLDKVNEANLLASSIASG